MNVSTVVHGPQRMMSTDFGDPMTFHLMPPAGQSSQLHSDKFHHLLDGLDNLVQTVIFPSG